MAKEAKRAGFSFQALIHLRKTATLTTEAGSKGHEDAQGGTRLATPTICQTHLWQLGQRIPRTPQGNDDSFILPV